MKTNKVHVMTLHFVLIMIELLSKILKKKKKNASRHIQVFGSTFPCIFGF